MTPDQLSSRFVLVDGQQGFVGETGTITAVEQDGTFNVSDFVRQAVEPPKRTGRLSPDAVGRLARTLADARLSELPNRISGRAVANPRLLHVRYGASDVTLVLPPDADLEHWTAEAPEGADAPTARVLRVWRVVHELLGAS
jgi:hypothetical protein